MQVLIVVLGLTLICLGSIYFLAGKSARQPSETASLLVPLLLVDVLEEEFLGLFKRAGHQESDAISSALRRTIILGQMIYLGRGDKEYIVWKLEECFRSIESGELRSEHGLEEVIDAARSDLHALEGGHGDGSQPLSMDQK